MILYVDTAQSISLIVASVVSLYYFMYCDIRWVILHLKLSCITTYPSYSLYLFWIVFVFVSWHISLDYHALPLHSLVCLHRSSTSTALPSSANSSATSCLVCHVVELLILSFGFMSFAFLRLEWCDCHVQTLNEPIPFIVWISNISNAHMNKWCEVVVLFVEVLFE